MRLSLSVRIAEAPTKDRMTMPFEQFVELAQATGYPAVCLRASAGGVQSSAEHIATMREQLAEKNLAVSMVTTDFDVPLNNERGPNNLRQFERHLDLAESFGATLIRVCMKTEQDIGAAATASDLAAKRQIRVAHQCHSDSLFETIDQCIDVVQRVGRENFGLIYEPGNLLLCGQPYGSEALVRLRPYIFNVYLQNHRLDPDGPEVLFARTRGDVRFHNLPLWEPGGIDFAEVFAGLKQINYNGFVTVHQEFARLMGPEEAATRSFDFLTGLI